MVNDTVFYDAKCWHCKSWIGKWQTKVHGSRFREMDAIDLMNQDNLSQIEIHQMCGCDKWNSKIITKQDALENKWSDSCWNYRMLYRVYPSGKEDVAIYEVYYENGKPVACTEDPVEPHGENLEDFQQDFEQYKQALFKPILRYDEFPDDELPF